MQIKEFEAFTLKECLQLVRDNLGPDAVILETRKSRKGGVMGWGAREAVCIVAATGITVQNDLPPRKELSEEKRALVTAGSNGGRAGTLTAPASRYEMPAKRESETIPDYALSAAQAVAVNAARQTYARAGTAPPSAAIEPKRPPKPPAGLVTAERTSAPVNPVEAGIPRRVPPKLQPEAPAPAAKRPSAPMAAAGGEPERFASLERAMQEIREGLNELKQQQEAQARTVTAVVSAVTPAGYAAGERIEIDEKPEPRFPEIYRKMADAGVSESIIETIFDALPDVTAWSSPAQLPMAEAAVRDLLSRRANCAGPIVLTPGRLKAVALIGPTGVGKTTTIAKLAAHFALVECKKVALITVDTYRIAAVEQLKTYSQIIDIPIGVAYSQAEVMPAVAKFADFDLVLIDTAGRSQKNIMQVGELKALLESLNCETHLVLSSPVKESDMMEAASRFSAARVDRILFTKLDETSTYGTLLNVADRTGIPLSYLTTGQKVPEDMETADGRRLAELILS